MSEKRYATEMTKEGISEDGAVEGAETLIGLTDNTAVASSILGHMIAIQKTAQQDVMMKTIATHVPTANMD